MGEISSAWVLGSTPRRRKRHLRLVLAKMPMNPSNKHDLAVVFGVKLEHTSPSQTLEALENGRTSRLHFQDRTIQAAVAISLKKEFVSYPRLVRTKNWSHRS